MNYICSLSYQLYLDISTFLILLGQFSDEFQIASRQIALDPLVYAAVQFRTEMVLPVARFTLIAIIRS